MFIEDVRKLKPLPLQQIPSSPHLRRTSSVGMMMATRMSSMDRIAAGWSGGRQWKALGSVVKLSAAAKAASQQQQADGASPVRSMLTTPPRVMPVQATPQASPNPLRPDSADRRARLKPQMRPSSAERRQKTGHDWRWTSGQQKESKMVIYGEMAAAAVAAPFVWLFGCMKDCKGADGGDVGIGLGDNSVGNGVFRLN